MYLWQIEYNCNRRSVECFSVVNRFKFCIFDRLNTTHKIHIILYNSLWIALNFVSLTDWIQLIKNIPYSFCVVNRFKFFIFDRLNTTLSTEENCSGVLWIALNFVSLTDWIQLRLWNSDNPLVVNRFKFCIFDRLNTTHSFIRWLNSLLWIALNFVSLTDWIQRWNSCKPSKWVVNRFKFCIFDRLNTTYK